MNDLQQLIYDISQALLWPVLIAAVACLLWVLVELGYFVYELWLRFRFRDLDALEGRTLRARRAFEDGKPRTAYRYLQENRYSVVVSRFLFDLIRNYQTERLEAKPLKLLQESELATLKHLERTRILVRVGPMLGLMGTLIPLSPALLGLAEGDTIRLTASLTTAFSVTVIGLLTGGLAYMISVVRDRMYTQDISDMEYLLELLEGASGRLKSGRRRSKKGVWESNPVVEYVVCDEEAGQPKERRAAEEQPATAKQPAARASVSRKPSERPAAAPHTREEPLGFDDSTLSWRTDDDPFADLGPAEEQPRKDDPEAPAPDDTQPL